MAGSGSSNLIVTVPVGVFCPRRGRSGRWQPSASVSSSEFAAWSGPVDDVRDGEDAEKRRRGGERDAAGGARDNANVVSATRRSE